MGHSQAEKAENRERILAEASRQVRRDGLESVGVGTLMKSVGLTHGGFYGHFESRSALSPRPSNAPSWKVRPTRRSRVRTGPRSFCQYRSRLSQPRPSRRP